MVGGGAHSSDILLGVQQVFTVKIRETYPPTSGGIHLVLCSPQQGLSARETVLPEPNRLVFYQSLNDLEEGKDPNSGSLKD